MSTKQKLELNWIGKHKRPRLEPRILLEDKALSYGEADSENLLIHGDNLLALKALEQEYAGKVKCIFIDPPYNTGSAFSHYDDGIEHSLWLTLMHDRLELLYTLLAHDGSLWITIDDNESHYLKVMCDEVFGRNNFVSNVIWQKKYAPQNDAKWLSDSHDHILVYAKNKQLWRPYPLPRTKEMDEKYKNPDNDPRGPWMSDNLSAKTYSAKLDYTITTPSGRQVNPPESRSWVYSKDKLEELIKDNRIWFGEKGTNVPRIKRFLSEVKQGSVCKTIWLRDEVGDNQDSKREIKAFFKTDSFSTPKPEKLIERILQLATKSGDLVLDSFAGSGTTGAVAHKMGRRWIMVELGDHCQTHIVPRLKKVINGEDLGGISKSVNWQGGGGFRYFHLAPSLLKKDNWGNWVINKEYNAEMLAEAMCKHMNFTYAPSQTQYWNHGYSTETDYIYVTTGSLAYEQLKVISEEVGTERTLLICCKAFMTEGADFPNLTLVKIPRAILSKCEWDQDDYSFTLNVLSDSEQPDEIDYDEDTEGEEQL
ncbi:TPA: site-specific DNA-methyltransferase [Citrobacter amalonaticus]|nr:site-specific DNA-methyltransferase [Citrobacter amalonaticus]